MSKGFLLGESREAGGLAPVGELAEGRPLPHWAPRVAAGKMGPCMRGRHPGMGAKARPPSRPMSTVSATVLPEQVERPRSHMAEREGRTDRASPKGPKSRAQHSYLLLVPGPSPPRGPHHHGRLLPGLKASRSQSPCLDWV